MGYGRNYAREVHVRGKGSQGLHTLRSDARVVAVALPRRTVKSAGATDASDGGGGGGASVFADDFISRER